MIATIAAAIVIVIGGSSEPFATWANESRAPNPPSITVNCSTEGGTKIHASPGNVWWWTCGPESTGEQYRGDFYHEVGHLFMFALINPRERYAYLHLINPIVRHRGFERIAWPSERFADDYARCALGYPNSYVGYGFRPAPFNRVCKLILSMAKGKR